MTQTTSGRFGEASVYAAALQAALQRRAGNFGYLATHPVQVVAVGYNQVHVLHEDGYLAAITPVYAPELAEGIAALIFQQAQMTIAPRHASGEPMTFNQSLHPAAQK